jgi:hypothetical protein
MSVYEESMVISSRFFVIFAIAICVVHVAIRMYDLDRESLDFDEAMTWNHTQSVHHVLPQTVLDVHPPLYFLGMSVWRKGTGESEWSLRVPSVAFSLLTLVTLMVFAHAIRPEVGKTAALMVGILFCLLPYDILLSRYARSWTMTMFLCALHSFLYFRATSKSSVLLFAVSCAVGLLAVYTHYIAILSIIGTMLAATLTYAHRRNIIGGAVSLAVMGLLVAPWALVLPVQFVLKTGCPHFTSVWDSSVESFITLMNPGRYSLEDLNAESRGALYSTGVMLSVVAIGTVLCRFRNLLQASGTRVVLLQVCFILLLLCLSPTPLINAKTLCILVCPLLLLVTACLTDLYLAPRRWLSIASVGFICAFGFVSLAGFPYPSQRSGWKEVCRYLTTCCKQLDRPLVLLSHTEEILPFEYQQSRGEGTDITELWIPMNSVGILHEPYDKALQLHKVDAPPTTVPDARLGPVREEGLVWVANHLFDTQPGVSLILYVRKGSGNLFGQSTSGPVDLTHQSTVARFTMSRVGRFSGHVIYRIERPKAEQPGTADPNAS